MHCWWCQAGPKWRFWLGPSQTNISWSMRLEYRFPISFSNFTPIGSPAKPRLKSRSIQFFQRVLTETWLPVVLPLIFTTWLKLTSAEIRALAIKLVDTDLVSNTLCISDVSVIWHSLTKTNTAKLEGQNYYLSFKSQSREAVVRVHQSENIYPELQPFHNFHTPHHDNCRPRLNVLWIWTQPRIHQVLGKITDSQIRPSQLEVKLQSNPAHETHLKPIICSSILPVSTDRGRSRRSVERAWRYSLIYRQVDHIGTFHPQTSWLTRQLLASLSQFIST